MNLFQLRDDLIAEVKAEQEKDAVYAEGIIDGIELFIKKMMATVKVEAADAEAKEKANTATEGTEGETSSTAVAVEDSKPEGFLGC